VLVLTELLPKARPDKR